MSFSGFVTVEVLSFVLFYFFQRQGASSHVRTWPKQKRAQTSPLFFFWLLCILFGVFIYAGIFKPAATYPFETLYNKNAYEQQFDAFLKHRLSIDIEPKQRNYWLFQTHMTERAEWVYASCGTEHCTTVNIILISE